MPSNLALASKFPLRPSKAMMRPELQAAIRLILNDGKRIDEAAQSVGLTTYTVRQSLDKPHVQAFIRREKQVRLENARLDNINDLERIKRGTGAAAIAAIRLLEEMAAPEAARVATSAATLPGVTINIISNQPQSDEGQHVQPMVIEHEPDPARTRLVDQPSSQAKESSVKKAGGKNPGRHARS